MAIGNGELMQECFPKHLRMGTARMKKDNKQGGVRMERSKVSTKEKRSPDGINYHYQNKVIINIDCQYFVRDGKKYNEIQLTKNKIDFNNQKIKNHLPFMAI